MADEEFHEIQLNGKQLVFLFMAGTVAAVVIFLCGLMVGRNLRSPKLEATAAAADTAVTDPTRAGEVPPPTTAPTEGGSPVTTNETLTYASRLEAPTPVTDTLKEEAPDPTRPDATAKPAPAPVEKTPAKQDKPAAAPPAAAAAAPLAPEPAGTGWTVQVQAVKTRDAAEAVVKSLVAKGYPAFITTVGDPTPTFYRVRVGKFPDKKDAEAMKAKLQKQEHFNPILAR